MSARALLTVGTILCFVTPSYAADWRLETDRKEIAARAEHFEAELLDIGFAGDVVSCSHVVREAEGRVGYSWGAICTLKTK